jgi:hypothetical protein
MQVFGPGAVRSCALLRLTWSRPGQEFRWQMHLKHRNYDDHNRNTTSEEQGSGDEDACKYVRL